MVESYVVFAITLVLLGLSVLSFRAYALRVRREVKELGDKVDKSLSDGLEKIVDRVRPRVVHCASRAEVCREVAQQFDNTVKEYKNSVHKGPAGGPSGTTSANDEGISPRSSLGDKWQVMIFGAMDLAHFPEGESEDTEHAANEYTKAKDRLMSEGIPVSRYVSLIKPESLKGRSAAIVEEYVGWLKSQSKTLEKAANYKLCNNVRAPEWGSASMTVLTPHGFTEVKADGQVAISVEDDSIGRSLMESGKSYLNEASATNKNDFQSRNPHDTKAFSHFIERFQRIPGKANENLANVDESQSQGVDAS